jgi:hypothetical protein
MPPSTQPLAITDEALSELFCLATPLDPLDRTAFVEDVVAQLSAHAEIDVGLVHQVGRATQRKYLGFVRGTGTSKYR